MHPRRFAAGLALERGGSDNITILAGRAPGPGA